MIFLYPKAIKKSKKVSILENDRRGFVTLSDHCAVPLKCSTSSSMIIQNRTNLVGKKKRVTVGNV